MSTTMTVTAIVAPTIQFIDEPWRGRGFKKAFLATRRGTLGVAVRKRRNGLVAFDADLWRLDLDLHPDAASRLYSHWNNLNRAHNLSKKVMWKMDRHFSKTVISFTTTAEQVEEWKDFLMVLLSDTNSYIDIEAVRNKAIAVNE